MSDAYSRELPNQPDAERALLGCVLMNPGCVPLVARILSDGSAEFFFERHAIAYDAALGLHHAGRPIDGVLIKDELVRRNQFDQVGGFPFLADLAASVPSAHRAAEYAALVHDAHTLRQSIRGAHELLEAAFSRDASVAGVLAKAREISDSLCGTVVSDTQIDQADLVEEIARAFEAGETENFLPTGLRDVDAMIGGLCAGELTALAGLRSSGKSALGLNIADYAANTLGAPTLFVSLEMSKRSVGNRILAAHAQVNTRHIRMSRRFVDADAPQRWQEALARLRKRSLRIDYSAGIRLSPLAALIRADHMRRGTQLVVIDQQSHIRMDRGTKFERTDQAVGEKFQTLKLLAKGLGIAIIVLCQLNRGPEKENRPPKMGDIRDSAEIEHHADVILLVHNPAPSANAVAAVYRNGEEVKTFVRALYVAKNRDGEANPELPIYLRYTPPYCQFTDGDVDDRHRIGVDSSYHPTPGPSVEYDAEYLAQQQNKRSRQKPREKTIF